MKTPNRQKAEVNAGSMADIAFLLLIFFLVTTTIAQDKGLSMLLPPPPELNEPIEFHNKDLLKILVNSKDEIFLEDEPSQVNSIKDEVINFLNNTKKPYVLHTSPEKAVVSIKTDRGTSYETYLSVLNEVKAAYHQLRADAMKISLKAYLDFDKAKAKLEMLAKYESAKQKFPMRISEAEPSK